MSETTVVKGQFGLEQSGGMGKKLKITFILQMSRQCPPKYNSKQLQLQYVNTLVNIHDLNCGCDSPLECTVLTIYNQEKDLKFTKQEKQQLRKWLTTTEENTTQEEDAIGDGDLERLFADDFGEEKDTDTR